ncbi:hypothetical protein MIN45_P0123 [Methylomarinovum tepidoasis]|uniref:O-antigen ligase-related domain-containing protein n=1 Tax=Methylomarinovum tepidoasis TaxID=2840183 RepID=A0AAU9CEW9_9GAMM|nr:hypothetical protein MIN45_P0123 [Methylomarinovum sp. IN45]
MIRRNRNDPLYAAFLALVFLLPLPMGGNRIPFRSVLAGAVFLLVAVWLWQWYRGNRPLTPALRAARPALITLALWSLYVALQLLPLPVSVLARISPEAAKAYLVLHQSTAPLTLENHATRLGWLQTLAYTGIFLLTLALIDSRKRVKTLVLVLVTAGTLQALYGTFMVLSGLEWGFPGPKPTFWHRATGTFVSRNNLANYLVLCLSVGLGHLLAQSAPNPFRRSWRQRLRHLLDWFLGPGMRLRLMLLVMTVALVMTRSRMGNASFFFALLSTACLMLFFGKRRVSPAVLILISSLLIVDVFFIGSLVGLDKVVHRLEQTENMGERGILDTCSLRYWQDYPWSGSGLGSYYVSSPVRLYTRFLKSSGRFFCQSLRACTGEMCPRAFWGI